MTDHIKYLDYNRKSFAQSDDMERPTEMESESLDSAEAEAGDKTCED